MLRKQCGMLRWWLDYEDHDDDDEDHDDDDGGDELLVLMTLIWWSLIAVIKQCGMLRWWYEDDGLIFKLRIKVILAWRKKNSNWIQLSGRPSMIPSRGFLRRGEESRRQKERKSQDCKGRFFNYLLLGNLWFQKLYMGKFLQVPLLFSFCCPFFVMPQYFCTFWFV